MFRTAVRDRTDDGSEEPVVPRGIEFTVVKKADADYVNNSTETYKFLFDRVFEPSCAQVRGM